MKQCLVDVNVLLPLLVRHHEHREIALRWFDMSRAGEIALCRFVQLGLVRLLANRTIMGDHSLSASRAWGLIAELLEDERVEFAPEPALIESYFPGLLNYSAPTHKLVGDAYLAAFSIAGAMRLTTFDQGFRQFRGIELELLSV